MALPFHNIIVSEAYTFCIGAEKRELVIHADAIAGLSPALKSLLKNEAFAEANNKRVIWDDVEVDTFLRFVQYAYTGDYKEPSSSPILELKETGSNATPANTTENAALADDDDLELEEAIIWPNFVLRQVGKGRMWKCTACWAIFYDSEMNNGCPRCPSQFYSRHYKSAQETRFQSAGLQHESDEWKPEESLVFPGDQAGSNMRTQGLRQAALSEKACSELLDEHAAVSGFKPDAENAVDGWTAISEHAKLYVLGDKWGIDRLKALALRKIQVRLEHVSVQREGMSELFDLVRFVYDNTASEKDMFRGLVTHFMVAEIMTDEMGRRKGFFQLLEDIPDFAKAVWSISYRMRMI